MSKFSQMRTHRKMFPWLRGFYGKYGEDYFNNDKSEAIEYLLHHVDKEVKSIEEKEDILELEEKSKLVFPKHDKARELYVILNAIFPHFWWRIRWNSTETWKTSWEKGEFSTNSNYTMLRNCCVYMLKYMLHLAMFLTDGDQNSSLIKLVSTVLQIPSGTTDISYSALLLVKDLKKKYCSVYTKILRNMLCRNIFKDNLNPVEYSKIILLFRRLWKYTYDIQEKKRIVFAAIKLKIPENMLVWLSSQNLKNCEQLKPGNLTEQFLSRPYPDELLRSLHEIVTKDENLIEKEIELDTGEAINNEDSEFHNSLQNISELSFECFNDTLTDESQLMENGEYDTLTKLNSYENGLNLPKELDSEFNDKANNNVSTPTKQSEKKLYGSDNEDNNSYKEQDIIDHDNNYIIEEQTQNCTVNRKKKKKSKKHKKKEKYNPTCMTEIDINDTVKEELMNEIVQSKVLPENNNVENIETQHQTTLYGVKKNKQKTYIIEQKDCPDETFQKTKKKKKSNKEPENIIDEEIHINKKKKFKNELANNTNEEIQINKIKSVKELNSYVDEKIEAKIDKKKTFDYLDSNVEANTQTNLNNKKNKHSSEPNIDERAKIKQKKRKRCKHNSESNTDDRKHSSELDTNKKTKKRNKSSKYNPESYATEGTKHNYKSGIDEKTKHTSEPDKVTKIKKKKKRHKHNSESDIDEKTKHNSESDTNEKTKHNSQADVEKETRIERKKYKHNCESYTNEETKYNYKPDMEEETKSNSEPNTDKATKHHSESNLDEGLGYNFEPDTNEGTKYNSASDTDERIKHNSEVNIDEKTKRKKKSKHKSTDEGSKIKKKKKKSRHKSRDEETKMKKKKLNSDPYTDEGTKIKKVKKESKHKFENNMDEVTEMKKGKKHSEHNSETDVDKGTKIKKKSKYHSEHDTNKKHNNSVIKPDNEEILSERQKYTTVELEIKNLTDSKLSTVDTDFKRELVEDNNLKICKNKFTNNDTSADESALKTCNGTLSNKGNIRKRKLFNIETDCNVNILNNVDHGKSLKSLHSVDSTNITKINSIAADINNCSNSDQNENMTQILSNANRDNNIDDSLSESNIVLSQEAVISPNTSISELLQLQKVKIYRNNKALGIEMNEETSLKNSKKLAVPKTSTPMRNNISENVKRNKKDSHKSHNQSDSSLTDNNLLHASKKVLKQSQNLEHCDSPSLFSEDSSSIDNFNGHCEHNKPKKLKPHSLAKTMNITIESNQSKTLTYPKKHGNQMLTPSNKYMRDTSQLLTETTITPDSCNKTSNNVRLKFGDNDKNSDKTFLEKYSGISSSYVVSDDIQKVSSKTSNINQNFDCSPSNIMSENYTKPSSVASSSDTQSSSCLSPHIILKDYNASCSISPKKISPIINSTVAATDSEESNIYENLDSNSSNMSINLERPSSVASNTSSLSSSYILPRVVLKDYIKSSSKSPMKHSRSDIPSDFTSLCKDLASQVSDASNVEFSENQDHILQNISTAEQLKNTNNNLNYPLENNQSIVLSKKTKFNSNNSNMSIDLETPSVASSSNSISSYNSSPCVVALKDYRKTPSKSPIKHSQAEITSYFKDLTGLASNVELSENQEHILQNMITTEQFENNNISYPSNTNQSNLSTETGSNSLYLNNCDIVTDHLRISEMLPGAKVTNTNNDPQTYVYNPKNSSFTHNNDDEISQNNKVTVNEYKLVNNISENFPSSRSVGTMTEYNNTNDFSVNANVNNHSNFKGISSMQVIINMTSTTNDSAINTNQIIANFDFQSILNPFSTSTSPAILENNSNPVSNLVNLPTVLHNVPQSNSLPIFQNNQFNEASNSLLSSIKQDNDFEIATNEESCQHLNSNIYNLPEDFNIISDKISMNYSPSETSNYSSNNFKNRNTKQPNLKNADSQCEHSYILDDLRIINSNTYSETNTNLQNNESSKIEPLTEENIALINSISHDNSTNLSSSNRGCDIYSELSSDNISISTMSIASVIETDLEVGKNIELSISPTIGGYKGRGYEVSIEKDKNAYTKPKALKKTSRKLKKPNNAKRNQSIPTFNRDSGISMSTAGSSNESAISNNILSNSEITESKNQRYNLRNRKSLQQPKTLEEFHINKKINSKQ